MRHNSGPRICVASTGLGHVTRGVESWADDLGKALANRGEQVTLCKGDGRANADYETVIPCWTRTSSQTDRLLRCLPNAIGWRIGLGSPYSVEQSTFAVNLIRFLRKQSIDVLHVQDPQLALWVQHARRIGLCKTRTVFGHVTEEASDWLRQFEYLHHIAPWNQEWVATQGVTRETWTTIPNFINTQKFKPGDNLRLRKELLVPPEARVVLVSSAIKRKHKRVDYLIDEVSHVLTRRTDLPIYLVIAGAREQETDELIQYAQRKLGNRVRFAVSFPRDRMPELYQMADLLIHGSLFEMFGTVLLEATASGIPCIVHSHPVMKWVLGPGGLATDLSKTGNLSSAIISLLGDKEQCDRIGALARNHCRQKFSEEVVVDQFLRYYDLVLNDGLTNKAA